jgi:2-polyprenyl-3-methyl-5-hydroxy-6-metoxy-1,4-benzoquinol methylase
MTIDLSELNLVPDVVIASEVLEHIQDRDLINILSTIRQKLKLGGLLLVTVPNGYGWFEMESFVWFKTGIGRILQSLRIVGFINKLKFLVFGKDIETLFPSTLSRSSHRQCFTHHSIVKLLEDNGFEVIGSEGSVLFAGPFSNLFFTGIRPIMKINCILGGWLPRFASGFYISCRARKG